MKKTDIFSIDLGYGSNKFAKFDKDGKFIFGKTNIALAEAPKDTDDMPLFEGKKYYIGDEALMEESSKIINVIDYKKHEEISPLSLWYSSKEEGVDLNSLDSIAISLSLAQKDYANSFIRRLTKFRVNEETIDLKGKIKLVPQAVGAKYAIDHYYYSEDNRETYAIIDLGQLTADLATVINGKIRLENADGFANEGVIKIINQIQEHVAKNFSEVISIKEAQDIMITKKYNLYGEIDFSSEIEGFKEDYTNYILSILQQRHKNIFKKYPKIYFVGGGAYYISRKAIKNFKGISEETLVFPENPEYLNAIGGLILLNK